MANTVHFSPEELGSLCSEGSARTAIALEIVKAHLMGPPVRLGAKSVAIVDRALKIVAKELE